METFLLEQDCREKKQSAIGIASLFGLMRPGLNPKPPVPVLNSNINQMLRMLSFHHGGLHGGGGGGGVRSCKIYTTQLSSSRHKSNCTV